MQIARRWKFQRKHYFCGLAASFRQVIESVCAMTFSFCRDSAGNDAGKTSITAGRSFVEAQLGMETWPLLSTA